MSGILKKKRCCCGGPGIDYPPGGGPDDPCTDVICPGPSMIHVRLEWIDMFGNPGYNEADCEQAGPNSCGWSGGSSETPGSTNFWTVDWMCGAQRWEAILTTGSGSQLEGWKYGGASPVGSYIRAFPSTDTSLVVS